MAKFSRKSKLSKSQTQELIIDLCESIASVKDSQEAAKLLTDLLGKQELEMLARRLKVAEMLLDEQTYDDICEALKISRSTIARVQAWLQNSGEGYRLVMERTKKSRGFKKRVQVTPKFTNLKRKYPIYFWPQIAMEYWLQNSSRKHKEQMQKLLAKLDEKPAIYKELERTLRRKIVS
ncbi:MAG: hypothetical protein COT92_03080 [Candidatus Doudnabacteria bacterium CG10_big_fil_rev_8_21_14_0_10_42_18]|uniref:TrpR like protein, YerC/YecD n=1 Tax=Candidatus Doudnabacteria bacterium CG10_big_fil_rev_8_21_14_0_10_42_18 TaxID=1974552 RepID=A0A2H0VAC8_9BACT|nr:MAG: hypothetical protein COT92_03080 [Candidatus Doudnabacteria bacterium CG10_big_fil_rev_8_21_14_0_10_42_18]